MKTCPTCRHRLARNATSCPQCGRRFTSFVTKLATSVLLLFLALCGLGAYVYHLAGGDVAAAFQPPQQEDRREPDFVVEIRRP